MAIFASDTFAGGVGGTSIAGRTSSGGDIWSANLDSGHVGDAFLYPLVGTSSKVGCGTAANSSAIYALKAAPGPDYGVNFTFEFGNNVIGLTSVGPCLRFQETAVSASLHYYAVWYNGNALRWDIVVNNGTGVVPIASYSHVYASGTINDYIFRACGTTMELIENGVTIISVVNTLVSGIGQVGLVVPDGGASFSDTNGWWLSNLEANSTSCTDDVRALFGLYFAGAGDVSGGDFTPVDYGNPTPVEVTVPQVGYEYSIPVVPIDLAGFLTDNMGNVKLRRSSDDPQGTDPAVLRGISLKYKKTQS